MALAPNKTKLVCTIGPASESPDILRQMLCAGMNVARLNFSHGTFARHKTVIENLRRVATAVGRRVTIMADLPGPKIRIGKLAEEPIEVKRGNAFTLTTDNVLGDRQRVSVSFPRLPAVVKPGDCLFINDGNIQLEVIRTTGNGLQFTYGVSPVHAPKYPDDWNVFARQWMKSRRVSGELVVLMAAPSERNSPANPSLEIIDVRRGAFDNDVQSLPELQEKVEIEKGGTTS